MSLAQRIMELLNGIPHPMPTTAIARYCGPESPSIRSRVWEQLKRLERCGKVRKVSVVRGRGAGAKWSSAKWLNCSH